MSWAIGTKAQLAQLQATVNFADTGPGRARVLIYTTPRVAPGAEPGAVPQVDVELAKPCGTIVGGGLQLHPANLSGSLVMATGIPLWGRWMSASGEFIADGDVTDADHGGDLQIIGGQTPEGGSSPLLYAGSLVVVGDMILS